MTLKISKPEGLVKLIDYPVERFYLDGFTEVRAVARGICRAKSKRPALEEEKLAVVNH